MANLSIGFQDDNLLDDDSLLFGSDNDYSIRYDSTKDKLVVRDEINNVDGFQVSRNGLVEIPNSDASSNSLLLGGHIKTTQNFSIRTAGGGNNRVRVFDQANSQKIAIFKEGGDIEVPNGRLTVTTSSTTHTLDSGLLSISRDDFPTLELDDPLNTQSWYIQGSRQDGNFYIRDSSNSLNMLSIAPSSGDVTILSGPLQTAGLDGRNDSLKVDGHVKMTGTGVSGTPVIRTPGGGSDRFRIYDDANGQSIITANEGGKVEIPSGDLNMKGNAIQRVDQIAWRDSGAASDDWNQFIASDGRMEFKDQDNNVIGLVLNQGGLVEIPSGNLTLSGGNINAGGAKITNLGNNAANGDASDPSIEMENGNPTWTMRDSNANGALPSDDAVYFKYGDDNYDIGHFDASASSTNTRLRLDINTGEFTIFSGPLDMSKNRIDNRTGYLSGYLSTSQSNAEDGLYVNVFENLEVSDGPYTKDSSSQVTVNQSGRYRISWTVTYNQNSGGTRSCLHAYPEINTTKRQEVGGDCYIRNDQSGRRNSADGETVLSLASGDTVQIYTTLDVGNNNPHSVVRASAELEYLG